jgi:hypothetical protein
MTWSPRLAYLNEYLREGLNGLKPHKLTIEPRLGWGLGKDIELVIAEEFPFDFHLDLRQKQGATRA